MAQKRIPVTIIGKSPLLTHNPASMGKGKSGIKGEKYIPTPEEEADAGLYRLDGHYGFPGIGVRNCYVIASGAWKVKIPGSSRKMSARSIISSTMVEPELLSILDPKTGKPLKGYTIDTRRAVVQRNGVLRSRPRFDNWRLDFEIVYDEENLTEETVLQLMPILKDGGRRIGIGDYRPAKSGWFGMFTLPETK